ncbi:MAG: DUF3142 domain-containing protein [Myxococcota bacterium]
MARLFLALLLVACTPPRAAGPMGSDAYVWQRAWTPPVSAAVVAHGGRFERLGVLAAEVTWAEGAPVVTEVVPDAGALAGHDVVAVLRVASWAGPFDAELGLAEVAADTVRRFRDDGHAVVELQVDFDAASSQLGGYTSWMGAIRAASAVPVTITALPDWLARPELPALLAATDGWTLQVHDFSAPATVADPLAPILDEAEALAAIERAATLNLPFRVALPTYGYTLAFAPDGAYIGATAEREVAWKTDVTLRSVRAEPVRVATVVARLTQDRPPEVLGLAWFRLPTEQDVQAWRWATLDAVMNGRAPTADVRALVEPAEAGAPGLFDVRVHNRGEDDALVTTVRIHGGDAAVVADGQGGFVAQTVGAEVHFRSKTPRPLAPGATRTVGWARYPSGTEVTVDGVE